MTQPPRLLRAVLCSALLTAPLPALAQGTIAVVPASPPDLSTQVRSERVAIAIRRALRARGAPVLSGDEMVRRFRQRHSAEPASVETGVYEELSACAEELLVAVSSARYRYAEQTGVRCRELAEQSLESLNRRTQSAREVLDACLMVVRATLDADSRVAPSGSAIERARAEILRCRAMVPDLPATSERHTERIRELLRDVDAALEGTNSLLAIDSQQPGCRVYVNGRRLGSTPLRRSGLPQGAYRVQVECGDAPGRVHLVTVGSAETELTIDERFDAAVYTPLPGSLGNIQFVLRYPSFDLVDRHRFDDAVTVAEAVGASDVWVVSSDGTGRYRVDRLGAQPCEAEASVLVALDQTDTELRFQAGSVAIDRLMSGQSADLSSSRERPFAPWRSAACAAASSISTSTGPPPLARPGANDGAVAAIWTATAVGLAALGAGWGLWGGAVLDGFDRDLQVAAVAAASGGALSLAIAAPLWLPYEDDFPWWSLLPATAGVGLAALGVGLLAVDGQCQDLLPAGGCVVFYATGSQGVLSLLSAAPLLEVPLVYLFRALAGPDAGPVAIHVQPTTAGAAVALEGSW